MAGANSFHCSVVTPEEPVLECEATFVAFPSHDGEVGVLVNRAPLVHKMGIGQLRVEAVEGEAKAFFVDGGFAQMVDNRLTLLTEQAIPVDELSAEEARADLDEALGARASDEASFVERTKAIDRARAKLRLAPSG
ncbi:MAG: ATP synthase F1 subunit epsilon [Gemmatimonadetes bacterium]|nr:ATP synthase F1 subunit epsilon [Gemmatimonadota bacterium]